MKKIKILTLFFVVLLCIELQNAYADIPFTVEIRNVNVNGGLIFIGYYTSQEALTNQKPDWHIRIEPTNETITYVIQVPAAGEYMIGLHQDTNGNGDMDYGLFGIPKEPYGFSNMKGKTPGKFNQLKFRINNPNERIIIPLVSF